MKVLLNLLLLLVLTKSSRATYCLCKDGIGVKALQTSIDYACGTLADCSPIHVKGSCYEPSTIKSHCDWAVNSYFQNSAQVPGTCDFSGTATISEDPPSNLGTSCIYPSSPRSPPPTITPPPTETTPCNGTTPPITETPITVTPPRPALGPTRGNGCSSLGISSVSTLCFSLLAFLWGCDVRLGFPQL